MQSQLGVVRNKTIHMKVHVSAGMAELGYDQIILYIAISKAGTIAINLRLLLAIEKILHLLICFIRNNNLFCCLPNSSTLSLSTTGFSRLFDV